MRKKRRDKYHLRTSLIIACVLLFTVCVWQAVKPLPSGLDYAGSIFLAEEVEFLGDLTYHAGALRVSDQEIFDRIFMRIAEAQERVTIDMFLFNAHLGGANSSHRQLSGEFTRRLIEKKQADPDVDIIFITDPINIVYGGAVSPELDSLTQAGIDVIVTDLFPLRDGNLLYSPFFRVFFRWFGVGEKGIFPHPFSPDEQGVSLRSYLRLLNFKANHRKMVEIDGRHLIVASANPHDGSSAHSNVAVEISGAFALEGRKAAAAVAEFSGSRIPSEAYSAVSSAPGSGPYEVRLLTEQSIRNALLSELRNVSSGDKVSLAMFYLSDRKVVKELIRCQERGAEVTVILDPNKDAFGYKKPGIPNRQVAKELVDAGIAFRWYATSGEQFHAKMILIDKADGTSVAILGSANFTRRNLKNYNLEMDVWVRGASELPFFLDARGYIMRIMENDGGVYTLPYEAYEDEALWKFVVYHLQERLGLSSF